MHSSDLLREADRCVKCGICLPHCPTYKLTRDEGDSPRGRISLIQALASGQLSSTETQYHLDRCLTCLACEASCPSGVRYHELIDQARSIRDKRSRLAQISHSLIAKLPYHKASRFALWLYRFSGVRYLLRAVAGRQFRRLDDLIPTHAKVGHWRRDYPATSAQQGRVGLFTGCAGRISDRLALDAAISVLNRLGFEVVIPTQQGCCGALHQHAGDSETALIYSQQNQAAFGRDNLDAVLYVASGCGAQLNQQRFSVPTWEISHFINSCNWPPEVTLNPLPYRIGLNTPCSLKHSLKLDDQPPLLLNRIPEIDLTPLTQIDCCGAAGSYLLEQPTLSDALRDKAMATFKPAELDFLATSNSGCALQLASGLRKTNKNLRVVHPIELIAMSMSQTD
ncbi:MAG: heterodisulfide reductase-related iron-sulfur binding cluster [Sedimenticola sp.]|nr:heterodisulfide reductase-related iron-sulfur binding cluster [Sedimenticola sp.]